ncbi:hypothetical protein PGRAN_13473 [Listeria grandensis FSL F6-0971]|uniref:Uncharacterized protein n=1 Tax=Listeria grandensis FSL F6-0971 TaxID=1265819 RepID=W7B839_9LIST|nr:hypothetical protein [Listeria grandensis]EUJ22077.1 hypothetical protein PGRAN_13473 [Listeria grandensis FSL F6-0971]
MTEVEIGEAKDILAPIITSGLYKGSTKISGKATPKATVFVSVFHKNEGDGAGTVVNVRVDDGGSWETGVLALKVGDTVRTSSSLGGVDALQSVGSHFVVKATNASGTKITKTKGTVLPK